MRAASIEQIAHELFSTSPRGSYRIISIDLETDLDMVFEIYCTS